MGVVLSLFFKFDELNAFVPYREKFETFLSLESDVHLKSETFRDSLPIKIWVAYMMSKPVSTVFADRRLDELIIKSNEGDSRVHLLRGASGGKLKGQLEMLIDGNGKLLDCEFEPSSSGDAIPIDELRVDATKIDDERIDSLVEGQHPLVHSDASQSTFKVVVGKKGVYSIFDAPDVTRISKPGSRWKPRYCDSHQLIMQRVDRHAIRCKLNGELELLFDGNGKLLSHEFKPNSSGDDAVCIRELRVDITKIEDGPTQQEQEGQQHATNSDPSRSVFKVMIGREGAYSIFNSTQVEHGAIPRSSFNNGIQSCDEYQDEHPEHDLFLQRIIGISRQQNASDVLFFRKRKRAEDIKFSFKAAVWLNAHYHRNGTRVPVSLRLFMFVFICLCGSILPLLPLGVRRMSLDQAIIVSALCINLLNFPPVLLGEGYIWTNVLSGFVCPSKLSDVASALRISVSELLFLSRSEFLWFPRFHLDTSQLSFLCVKSRFLGPRRDEWKEMNHYAVRNESFNKQFMLTPEGVGVIYGTSAQRGGTLTHNVADSEMMFPPFADFDECKHYLS